MNTHESYVSLETAKLLKQAGFDWKIDTFYLRYYEGDGHDNSIPTEDFSLYNSDYAHCTDWNNNPLTYINGILHKVSAPTLSVAQRWLREMKGWEAQVAYGFDEDGHKTYVTECGNPEGDLEDYKVYFPTYEETLEAGIKKALELILEKGGAL